MDNLIKQMRVKFSGIEEGNVGETSRVRDRKMSSQKTRSFKGDNRSRGRQSSSRELRHGDGSDYMESDEFRTAVAAAAFAINSAEEQRRRTRRRRDDSLKNKAKKKQEDGQVLVKPRERIQLPSSSSSSSLSNKMKNKEVDIVPISNPTLLPKKPSELQEKVPKRASRSPANTGESPRQSLVAPQFVIKKTPPPTPAPFDKTITSTKPESGLASGSHQQPPPSQTKVDKKRPQSRLEDIKADVWEKTEMERINERYEKLNAKILEWENEKQEKAKKKLSRKKDGSESKRARALETYKTDMEMIDQITEGARSQAKENRRKEIKKVEEKAGKIRLTGKIPTKTCLCL